ncbi:sulfite exporter TauE/SafE family protein [Alkalicoccobacillus porphyridii]|uniref:Probable membrane transporter protein n=1 Tax=Alkalicoccobacillus porphyridii TaxID=2597270 RepID=A0A553ZWW9_9BACI|nr:sulfite exporter TauE/SafE family protein [Alkalicoccobacillus porphyridii]TSB45933.1 sulfite exporter TauE/SafE family protein [Alkalicoccobacillus porphyridii]
MTLLIIVFSVVLIGAFLQGATGLGIGLTIAAVLPMFMTVKDTTLIVLTLLVVSGITVVSKYYRYIEWKPIRTFLVYVLVGRIAAFFILSEYGELEQIKVWLGFFLLLIVAYQLILSKLKGKTDVPNPTPKHVVVLILGMLAGLTGGLFGIGGVFFASYFLLVYPSSKYRYIVGIQLTSVLSSGFSLTMHAFNGDFHSPLVAYLLVGTMAVVLGTYFGLKLLNIVNAAFIKRVILILISLAALNLILFA